MIKYFLLFTLVVISLFITNLAICQEKPTVGVIDLELTSEIPPSAKIALSDELRKELFETGKFNVLERNSMAEILKEQKFQRTDACSETACIVEMGKVLGAQKMVAGSLAKLGNTYLLNVRLIDVLTGSIEQFGSDKCKCELEELISSIKTVAKKLAGMPVEERTRTSTEKEQQLPTRESKPNTERMVLIPEGEFLMGSPSGEGGNDEHPQHKVYLDAFYIDKYEVTQEEYEKVIGTNPSRFKGAKNPVESVTWYDAVKYCNARSIKEGLEPCYNEDTWECDFTKNGYRLPTEAEWEYVCRAGSSGKWSFGNEEGVLGDYAWYKSNCGGQTHPVGQKKPNAFGLYDMHGNVWEWCNDWYDEDYYKNSLDKNPKGPNSGEFRVLRGGSWGDYPFNLRTALRYGLIPGSRGLSVVGVSLGFRCSRTP